MVPTCWFW